MSLSHLIADANDVFGQVSPPPGVDQFNKAAGVGGVSGIGIILFISNLIKLATIIAGIWVLFNFITAGYIYITSGGDSAANNKVKDQLTSSVLGLIVIVGAYTVIALISYFLFHDPGYILNPSITGPGTAAPATTPGGGP